MKLTNVARASLEALRLDYEDFLRHHNLAKCERSDPRRESLIARRCKTADEVANWVKEQSLAGHGGLRGPSGQASTKSTSSIKSTRSTYPQLSANAALVLIAVACSLLDRQLASLAAAFERDGGFTERLFRVRSQARGAGR